MVFPTKEEKEPPQANEVSRGGEMVYTLALGASARKGVEVQVLSSAPNYHKGLLIFLSFGLVT